MKPSSIYYLSFKDADDNPLWSGVNCKLHLPTDVTAKSFCSVILYNAENRCHDDQPPRRNMRLAHSIKIRSTTKTVSWMCSLVLMLLRDLKPTGYRRPKASFGWELGSIDRTLIFWGRPVP
jgi:hypothetical protein